ncbi:MAG: methylmalonyl-CoA mutase [Chlorobi bacterium]|nr:methylmalonyl-CoA mutase [Chlorobiota bacterium]
MKSVVRKQEISPEEIKALQNYKPKHHVRIVTAASLFDGHDAAINLMRRIMQAMGGEVIHIGHDRSVDEVVKTAVEEDVQCVAVTSYQGGHMEYFTYLRQRLNELGLDYVRVVGGGGGTILPDEVEELAKYDIKIYTPDDGRILGLQGMIGDVLKQSDFDPPNIFEDPSKLMEVIHGNRLAIARAITIAENHPEQWQELRKHLLDLMHRYDGTKTIPVIGFTGTGGAGKSTVVDEFVRRFINEFQDKRVAIIAVDPSRRKTGGALLGDRIRMNAIYNERVYMRSMATRASNAALSKAVKDAIEIVKAAGFDLVIVESTGVGQADIQIIDYADIAVYVMTPEYGAQTQLEKINMLDYADVVVINKFDKPGAEDALRDVRKQYRRNHLLFDVPDEELPVFATIASMFNDPGMDTVYRALLDKIAEKVGVKFPTKYPKEYRLPNKDYLIPPDRTHYLAEITATIEKYNKWTDEQSRLARQWQQLLETIKQLEKDGNEEVIKALKEKAKEIEQKIDEENREKLLKWDEKVKKYKEEIFKYQVRDRIIEQPMYHISLSGNKIPRVKLPETEDWGERLKWELQENAPGEFPFTAGVYPLKNPEEDPIRMFAGEGTPERTNRRFHFLAYDKPYNRLSTAFDSVTLYGRDPDERPDIYGKIGNSGVSVPTLDDAKKLYSGFDLAHKNTSVSMTINGPAPMMLAMFFNTAIDQQCEKYIMEHGLTEEVEKKIEKYFKEKGVPRPTYKGELPKGHNGLGLMLLGITGDQVLPREVYENIKADTLRRIRGTVQADILKEDQAQNTCIFSIEFALKLMTDVQEYFVNNDIRNFYSVSISGYHIAEAGATPVTQLAFTLANAFTYVELYLHRGLPLDKFLRNFSFFFSNGMDPEYAVIGRVARRIWSKAIKYLYGGNERSQKLKYHIQTSGRSLHAQEIAFNDIRTTLEALYAIMDHCNSLHTNAYDEAITTPTEESVRRAVAIQLIINKEYGLTKNENPLQGSYFIEYLTDLVEREVLEEFKRIDSRGGVLGAMERGYQRSKIQEESMHYEFMKQTGKLPIIGVNTFLGPDGSPIQVPEKVVRSTDEEKRYQIEQVRAFHKRNEQECKYWLDQLRKAARENKNIFEVLMEAVKYCSLGQITDLFFEVGGGYRRNM